MTSASDQVLPFDERYRCTATARSGDRCRRRSIPGGSVCTMHGGASPQAKAAAQRRLEQMRLEGEIGALLDELDLPGDEDPDEVLRGAMKSATVMVELLKAFVAEMSAVVGPDHLGDLRAHPNVILLGDWTDRAARYAKLALDYGLEERRVIVDEARIELMRVFVVGVLLELGHEPSSAPVRFALERWAPVLDGAPAPLPVTSPVVDVVAVGDDGEPF